MVTLQITKKEAHFLRNRCIQARAVVYSNLQAEPEAKGDRYTALWTEYNEITTLINKLGALIIE